MTRPSWRHALAAAAWCGAILIVVLLVRRVGWAILSESVRAHLEPGFVAYLLLFILVSLELDAWATRGVLGQLQIDLSHRHVRLARGASYLAGIANYAAGQGALAWLLYRQGVAGRRAAALLFYLASTTALAAATLALVGIAVGPPQLRQGPLGPIFYLAVAIFFGYFPLLHWARKSDRLRRSPMLDVLLAADRRDHLVSTAFRLVHLSATSFLGWGALAVWGLRLPGEVVLPTLSIMPLLASLPITPSGLGTVQAAQVLIFAPFVDAPGQATREGSILSFSLTGHAIGLLFQLAISIFCLVRLRHTIADGPGGA